MKVEVKTNKKGVCEYFKLNGKEYGEGITSLDIHIEAGQLPILQINCKSDEFIWNSEDTELKINYIRNINKPMNKKIFNKLKNKFRKDGD